MKALIRKAMLRVARAFKGPTFDIDTAMPLRALIGYSFRRGMAMFRCVLRGVVLSLNPGKLVFIGPDVELRNRRGISIGAGSTLGKGVIIDGLSKEGVVIGRNVNIGPYSIIEATGVISQLGKGLRIGANSGLGAYSFIGAAGGVSIGKNVIMGQRISFHSENHRFDRLDVPIRVQGVTHEGIVVEDDCWIGANVVFLDGAHVGHGSVIGAGAVVRGEIPPFSFAAGVPARIIRQRGKAERPD